MSLNHKFNIHLKSRREYIIILFCWHNLLYKLVGPVHKQSSLSISWITSFMNWARRIRTFTMTESESVMACPASGCFTWVSGSCELKITYKITYHIYYRITYAVSVRQAAGYYIVSFSINLLIS